MSHKGCEISCKYRAIADLSPGESHFFKGAEIRCVKRAWYSRSQRRRDKYAGWKMAFESSPNGVVVRRTE